MMHYYDANTGKLLNDNVIVSKRGDSWNPHGVVYVDTLRNHVTYDHEVYTWCLQYSLGGV